MSCIEIPPTFKVYLIFSYFPASFVIENEDLYLKMGFENNPADQHASTIKKLPPVPVAVTSSLPTSRN